MRGHAKFHSDPEAYDERGNPLGRGWPGFAYTFYIDKIGRIFRAWDDNVKTFHVGNGNDTALGVCLEGNFSVKPPSEKQIKALVWLYCEHYEGLEIKYHDDYKPNWKCPGKLFPKDRFYSMVVEYLNNNDIKDPEIVPEIPIVYPNWLRQFIEATKWLRF